MPVEDVSLLLVEELLLLVELKEELLKLTNKLKLLVLKILVQLSLLV